jgi:antitoxin component YwqK of YwqJK toxin-antitoxin module
MKKVFYCLLAISLMAGCKGRKEKVQTWYDTEKKRMKEEYSVSAKDPEVREGDFKSFYEDGKVKEERHYTQGKLEGKAATYAKDGQKIEEADYKAGELDGKRRLYKNGKMIVEDSYKGGPLDGPDKMWVLDGPTKNQEGH